MIQIFSVFGYFVTLLFTRILLRALALITKGPQGDVCAQQPNGWHADFYLVLLQWHVNN